MAKVKETLLEIARECQEVRALANDPDMDMDVVIDSIESMEAVLETKVNAYGFVYRDMKEAQAAMQARIDYMDSVVKELKAKLKAMQNNEERFKDRLMSVMFATDTEEFHTEMFDIAIKTKGGVQELSVDEDKVPDSFLKVTYSVDKDKVREYLKDHTCDWARLLPRGKRIEIK